MSSIKSTLAAFALAFSAVLVGTTPVAAQAQAPQQVPLIEPAQVRGLMAMGGKITIVDVRRPDETVQGTIPGAILMPLDNLPNTFSSLPKFVATGTQVRLGLSGPAALVESGMADLRALLEQARVSDEVTKPVPPA